MSESKVFLNENWMRILSVVCTKCEHENTIGPVSVPDLESEIAELKDQIQVLVDGKFDQHIGSAATKKLVEALEKIADPRKRDHKEPDAYTEVGCLMNIADQALATYRREAGEDVK